MTPDYFKSGNKNRNRNRNRNKPKYFRKTILWVEGGVKMNYLALKSFTSEGSQTIGKYSNTKLDFLIIVLLN